MAIFPASPDLTTVPGDLINVRLPTDLVPDSYHVTLRPYIYSEDPDDFYFEGSVELDFKVTTATDVITLHYRDLDIDRDSITVDATNHPSQGNIQVTNYLLIPESMLHMYIRHDAFWVQDGLQRAMKCDQGVGAISTHISARYQPYISPLSTPYHQVSARYQP